MHRATENFACENRNVTNVSKSGNSPQREFLLDALARLDATRATFAARVGSTPSTVENWLAAPGSAAYRKMPDMVWLFVDELMSEPETSFVSPVGPSASQPQRKMLLDAMDILGLTRVEFSRRFGVPRRTLENWLADPGSTEHRALPELAKRFVQLVLSRDGLAIAGVATLQ